MTPRGSQDIRGKQKEKNGKRPGNSKWAKSSVKNTFYHLCVLKSSRTCYFQKVHTRWQRKGSEDPNANPKNASTALLLERWALRLDGWSVKGEGQNEGWRCI